MSVLAFELTETSREWLIRRPLEIALYIALALVVRFVLHKAIDRMTDPETRRRKREASRISALMLSLRSRTPEALRQRAPEAMRQKGSEAHRDVALRERRSQRAHTIGSVLKSTVSFVVLMWVIFQSLSIVGVNVAPFIASAGIVGVAIGFGAQNLVRDFLSGLFMLFEDQYGVGDVVDLGDAVGTVESVGLRVTTVRDEFGTLWYCRNGEVLRVGNYSQDYAIALLELPIAHSADVDLACRVALDAAVAAVAEEPLSTKVTGPPEMLGVNSVNVNAVTLRLTVTVRPNAQWSVQRELRQRILVAFEENGIPAPQLYGAALDVNS